ncbi:GPP34 family phosphoprotein [Kitasatospora sp. NPDC048239]|uniref:GOLPH3/VPS74 family protein n=1 Tax=Kitasatospora sp. NPDC048239 TaxID=3364046 RepID=UPI003723ECB6
MAPLDTRSIPEELLLLCVDPEHGRLRIPAATFHRVIAGGVLAELLVTGAISVDGRRITGYRPLGPADEVAAGVLARLEGAGKRQSPRGLDIALRRIPRKPGHRPYLDRLVAAGLVTAETRRVLGIPYRRYVAVRPDIGAVTAARVAATLERPADGSSADERDRQLAGLVAAARLDRRLYPGSAGAATRRAARQLGKELPVAQAVRRALNADAG